MATVKGVSCISIAASFALLAAARPALAQHDAHGGHGAADSVPAMPAHGMPGMASIQDATEASMTSTAMTMASNPHMRMTAMRPATAADSARARALADTLRQALAKYRDVNVAKADGYKQFAPQLKNQRVYHFTRNLAAVKAAFTFDASDPTSLLYTRDNSGKFKLVGAMYTAPHRTSEEDLNARVPLSIAHWHEHVNICVPGRAEVNRWKEMRDGKMLFGPSGAITTESECGDNGGRWFEHIFGWMVHANVFAGDDLATVWGDHH